jgi:hypothetical protein
MHNDQLHSGSEFRHDLAPITFYAELAMQDQLYDFLNFYLPEPLKNDDAFRKEMYKLTLDHSSQRVPELENDLLEDLCESLEFFLEYTSTCRT